VAKEHSESEKFDAAVRQILSVPRDELKRREEQWKRERAVINKKRKPRTSASGRKRKESGVQRP
jgi:hypothetical protein